MEQADVHEAFRLILSLQPRPCDAMQAQENGTVILDVVAWYADGQWRIALNPGTNATLSSINPAYERPSTTATPAPTSRYAKCCRRRKKR